MPAGWGGMWMTCENSRSVAHKVTRDVEPSTLEDLLEHPPRATVAFINRDQAEVVPALAQCRANTYRFGVLPELATDLENREVVVVIDDGRIFLSCVASPYAAWPGGSIEWNPMTRMRSRGT
jgi:hypothetical protein